MNFIYPYTIFFPKLILQVNLYSYGVGKKVKTEILILK